MINGKQKLIYFTFVVEANICYDDKHPNLHGNMTADCVGVSPVGSYIVPVMMAVYMLFTNVLLLNLLIAMFR
jgi:hypothetical protein